MSTFLYYVEGQKGRVDPAAHALGYALKLSQTGAVDIANPALPGEKKSGVLLFDKRRIGQANPTYLPAAQTWRKQPGEQGVWVGMYHDPPHRPTAASLLREQRIGGEWLTLADGGEWLVPRLRLFDAAAGFRVALPTKPDLDDEGNWLVGSAAPHHERLDQLAERLLDACIWSEFPEEERPHPIRLPTDREALEIAAELLAVNHAVGRRELAMLGVLELSPRLLDIARAAVDYDTAFGIQEGNSPASVA